MQMVLLIYIPEINPIDQFDTMQDKYRQAVNIHAAGIIAGHIPEPVNSKD